MVSSEAQSAQTSRGAASGMTAGYTLCEPQVDALQAALVRRRATSWRTRKSPCSPRRAVGVSRSGGRAQGSAPDRRPGGARRRQRTSTRTRHPGQGRRSTGRDGAVGREVCRRGPPAWRGWGTAPSAQSSSTLSSAGVWVRETSPKLSFMQRILQIYARIGEQLERCAPALSVERLFFRPRRHNGGVRLAGAGAW